jgi:hypothetical protein
VTHVFPFDRHFAIAGLGLLGLRREGTILLLSNVIDRAAPLYASGCPVNRDRMGVKCDA